MTIKLRAVGFHAPVTLPDDAVKYCEAVQDLTDRRNKDLKKGDARFAVPGNSSEDLKKVLASAQSLAPKAKRIKDLEADLSLAYQVYDKEAVGTWRLFSEARDFAIQYGENHEHADLSSIAGAYIYHTGRAARAAAAPTAGPAETAKTTDASKAT
jgi:hypothetical protein